MSSTHAQSCFEIHIHNFYEQVGRMIIPFSKLRCKKCTCTLACTKLQCVQINTNRIGVPVYLEPWVACTIPHLPPRGMKLPLCSLSPLQGEDTPGYAPTFGCSPPPPTPVREVKIPWPGELTPSPEHLTKLNAERFLF